MNTADKWRSIRAYGYRAVVQRAWVGLDNDGNPVLVPSGRGSDGTVCRATHPDGTVVAEAVSLFFDTAVAECAAQVEQIGQCPPPTHHRVRPGSAAINEFAAEYPKAVRASALWPNPFKPGAQIRYPTITGAPHWQPETRLHKPNGQGARYVHPDGSVTVHEVRCVEPGEELGLYREWVLAETGIEKIREDLWGRDLVCRCPDGVECHVDVLFQLANEV